MNIIVLENIYTVCEKYLCMYRVLNNLAISSNFTATIVLKIVCIQKLFYYNKFLYISFIKRHISLVQIHNFYAI